jgi:hypothetical protein
MSAAGHPTPPGPSSPPPTSTPPRVQRSGIGASPANGFATVTGARVQRSSTPAATPGSAAGPDGGVLDPATTSRIQRASGRGASLDSSLWPGLESALGADLGNVKIHADSPLRHRPSDQHPHAPGRGHRLLGEVALPGQGSQEAARRTRAVEAGGDDRTPGDESAPSRVRRLRCRERRRRDEGQQVRQEDGGLGVVDPRQDQPHHRCRCAQPRRRRPTRTRRQDPVDPSTAGYVGFTAPPAPGTSPTIRCRCASDRRSNCPIVSRRRRCSTGWSPATSTSSTSTPASSRRRHARGQTRASHSPGAARRTTPPTV